MLSTPYGAALLFAGGGLIFAGLWLLTRIRPRKLPAGCALPPGAAPAGTRLRGALVARPTRGPVAAPFDGYGAATTLVFPRLPAAAPPVAGWQHRAGRVGSPLRPAGPQTVRLRGASGYVPGRAAVPGRASEGWARPGTPPHAPARAVPVSHLSLPGRDQTVVLARIPEQHTETWKRPAEVTTGR